MSDEILRTDLTQEVPTGRAVAHHSLRKAEVVKVEAKLPGWLGGGTFKLTAQVHAGSAQSAGLTTLLLVTGSGLLAAIAFAIGVSAPTSLITGLCVSIGTFTLIQVIDFLLGRAR